MIRYVFNFRCGAGYNCLYLSHNFITHIFSIFDTRLLLIGSLCLMSLWRVFRRPPLQYCAMAITAITMNICIMSCLLIWWGSAIVLLISLLRKSCWIVFSCRSSPATHQIGLKISNFYFNKIICRLFSQYLSWACTHFWT